MNMMQGGLKSFMAALLFSALLCSVQTPLEAAATRLLVLDVQVGENVELPGARALFRRFRSKFRSTGLVRTTLARTTSVSMEASVCRTLVCAADVGRRLNMGMVLLGRVEKPGRDYVAEILLIAVSGNQIEVRLRERLPSLEPEDREQGAESLARRLEAEMRRLGYRPPRRLTPTERWLAVIPGLGQYLTGRNYKSGFFISAGFLTLQNFRNARREHRLAREQFQDTETPALIALGLRNEPQLSVAVNALYGARVRETLDRRAREGNFALILLGGLLTWNFLDAENDYEYFSMRRPHLRTARFEWRPDASANIAGDPANRTGRVVFVIRASF